MIVNQKSSTDFTTLTNCSRSVGFTQENTLGLCKKPNVEDSQIPASGAHLDALLNKNQATIRINPLPFVSTEDSVEMPKGSGPQHTVEYSICRIVPVLTTNIRYRAQGACKSGKAVIEDEAVEGKRASTPFSP